jgi:hypothetical protein
MIMEYTYKEYFNVLYVVLGMLLFYGNTLYVLLVDVMQILTCFDDCSSISVRSEV